MLILHERRAASDRPCCPGCVVQTVLGDNLEGGVPVFENVSDACPRRKPVARAVSASTICGTRETLLLWDSSYFVLRHVSWSKGFTRMHPFRFERFDQRVRMTSFMCQAMTNQLLACQRW